MNNDIKRFTMRIDNKVYEVVKQEAKRNKRSVAKEIEFVLEKCYEKLIKKI